MLAIFNEPTPLYSDTKKTLIRYFFVGCFIAFFLIFFQPFGTANIKMPNKTLFLSGYGWISFIVFSSVFIVLPRISSKWVNEESWVVWKQILLFIFTLTLTLAACFVYKAYWFKESISLFAFFDFLITVLPISIFPCTFIVLLDYIYQLKKNQNFATNLNQQIKPKAPNISELQFKDENGKNDFSINFDQLIFIKAANNYVEINYLVEDKIKKYLLRNSIRNVEQQLAHPSLKRSHRSYLVNLDKVGRITGNAQGYKLHFPFTAEFVVPVSRSKGKELLAILKQ